MTRASISQLTLLDVLKPRQSSAVVELSPDAKLPHQYGSMKSPALNPGNSPSLQNTLHATYICSHRFCITVQLLLFTYVHIYVYIHLCIYKLIYIYILIYMYLMYIYIHMFIQLYIYVGRIVGMLMCICICVYVYMHICV